MNVAPRLWENSPVGYAYTAWADHYNTCATCQQDDWYSPWPEETLLCDVGRPLFRRWVAANVVRVPLPFSPLPATSRLRMRAYAETAG